MIFTSRYPSPSIPVTDVLSYLFDDWQDHHPWTHPLFLSASNPAHEFLAAHDLLRLTRTIGCGLRHPQGANLMQGDVVLVCAPNSIYVPALFLGTLCSGAVMSGASPAYRDKELLYQLRDTGARAIFVTEDNLEVARRCCSAVGLPESNIFLVSTEKSTGRRSPRTLGDLLQYGEMDWERMSSTEQMQSRIAALNYSSGTTGLPKGCAISVFNIVAHCVQQQAVREYGWQRLKEQGRAPKEKHDVSLAYFPFYHAMGQQHFCFNGVKNGDTAYVMPAFSFDKFLQYVPRYKVTFLALVPPVVAGLARDPRVRSIDFSSVREAQCGGSPLGAELQRQAEEAMNPPGRPTRFQIHQGLGMSEVVLTATKFTPCDREEGLRKRGVGYLLPSMEMKLVDDSGRSLDYQQAGEILLRGPNVFPGYWRKDKETYDTFTEDGWYRTGDVGVMSRSGVLRVVDRKKELIKVKGFQVAPAELEALLLENVDVQDVAVVGVPGDGTEYPRAYVVPSQQDVDPQEISDFVASRLIHYKHLTGGVYFVESIPRNLSGKILRRQVREWVEREYRISNSQTMAKL